MVTVNNVIVDTGAADTIIDIIAVEPLQLAADEDDVISDVEQSHGHWYRVDCHARQCTGTPYDRMAWAIRPRTPYGRFALDSWPPRGSFLILKVSRAPRHALNVSV